MGLRDLLAKQRQCICLGAYTNAIPYNITLAKLWYTSKRMPLITYYKSKALMLLWPLSSGSLLLSTLQSRFTLNCIVSIRVFKMQQAVFEAWNASTDLFPEFPLDFQCCRLTYLFAVHLMQWLEGCMALNNDLMGGVRPLVCVPFVARNTAWFDYVSIECILDRAHLIGITLICCVNIFMFFAFPFYINKSSFSY